MTLTKVTYSMITGAPVNAADYGVVGDGVADDTTAIQAVLTDNPGKVIVFQGLSLISSPITVSGNNTRLVFMPGAGLTYTTATMIALNVSGNGIQIDNLNIVAPATFDGTNVQPTYGCVWVTGDNCSIDGLNITNVPKVGVMFKDCQGGTVINSTIVGNYPTGSFTGTQTAHAGVLIDADSTGRQGDFAVINCDISSCVQGVLIANYGSASRSQGILVNSNRFHSCWNHGVYGAGPCNGVGVTGNSFVFCQVPVAMTGAYHVVSSNTITTGGSTGAYTDITGISMRDPIQCVVANNTIQGESGVGQIVVALSALSGTIVSQNTVTGNSIVITGSGTASCIRLGGLTCTNLTDNVVTGNVCIGPAPAGEGIITLSGDTGCVANGSIVNGNTIVAKSASYGVKIAVCSGVSVTNNKYRLEYDAGAASFVASVQLASGVNCDVSNNTATVTAAWGTNITLYGVWEAGTVSGNRASNNTLRADPTKLTASLFYQTVSGSGIIVHDTGSGAPNLNAGVGSTWSRTDGGAGTSFYVKEAGNDALGWVGK